MKNELDKTLIQQPLEPEYELLVNNISTLWQESKKKGCAGG